MALQFSAVPKTSPTFSNTTAKSTPAFKVPATPLVTAPKTATNFPGPSPISPSIKGVTGFGPTNTPKSAFGTTSNSTPAYAQGGNYYNNSGSQVSTGLAKGISDIPNYFPNYSGGDYASKSSQLGSVAAFTGDNSNTFGVSDKPTPAPQFDTYNGRTGTTTSTLSGPYSASAGSTLEGQSSQNRADTTRARIDTQDKLSGQIGALTTQLTTEGDKKKQFLANQSTDIEAGAVLEGQGAYEGDSEISNLEGQLKSLQDELAKNQSSSQEEQEYEAQLRNLLASKEMGLQSVAEQPVPLAFITGQQSAIERRAANQSMPLQNRLASMQAKRSAASDAVKGRLSSLDNQYNRVADRQKEKRQNAFEIAKENREAQRESSKLTTVGEGQRLVDPLTGKVVYSAPKSYSPQAPKNTPTAVVEVGGRKKLINSQTGAVISDLGASSTGRDI